MQVYTAIIWNVYFWQNSPVMLKGLIISDNMQSTTLLEFLAIHTHTPTHPHTHTPTHTYSSHACRAHQCHCAADHSARVSRHTHPPTHPHTHLHTPTPTHTYSSHVRHAHQWQCAADHSARVSHNTHAHTPLTHTPTHTNSSHVRHTYFYPRSNPFSPTTAAHRVAPENCTVKRDLYMSLYISCQKRPIHLHHMTQIHAALFEFCLRTKHSQKRPTYILSKETNTSSWRKFTQLFLSSASELNTVKRDLHISCQKRPIHLHGANPHSSFRVFPQN